MEDKNDKEGNMRPIHFSTVLLLGSLIAVPAAQADACGDLATRFSGAERFGMKLSELDELKTCINLLLREKISATSQEARGSTSPAGGFDNAAQAIRPVSAPVLQDAE